MRSRPGWRRRPDGRLARLEPGLVAAAAAMTRAVLAGCAGLYAALAEWVGLFGAPAENAAAPVAVAARATAAPVTAKVILDIIRLVVLIGAKTNLWSGARSALGYHPGHLLR